MGDWAIVARESNAESDRSVKIFAVRSLSEIMTEGVIASTNQEMVFNMSIPSIYI